MGNDVPTTNAKLRNAMISWILEVSVFTLLPLLIYSIVYSSTGTSILVIFELPEWLLISIVLFGEATRKIIDVYKKLNTDHNVHHGVLIGIIGIVISSVLLGLLLLSTEESFELHSSFYSLQMFTFLIAIFLHGLFSIWLSYIQP